MAQALGVRVYAIGVGTRGEARVPVPDPLGGTRLMPMRVDIELQSTHTYGMTVCDRRHLSPSDNNARPLRAPLTKANAQVAVDVDASRFWDHFLEVLATYP